LNITPFPPHIEYKEYRPKRITTMAEAYIYDALRTPRGKGRKDGSLHEVTALRLSAVTMNALKERNNLTGHAVEDVIWGNVTQVMEQGGCLARSAVLASDLDESIPGLAINRFCASGMEAVNLAANQVKGGAGMGYIAGGVEMMGRVAMGSDGAAIAADPSIALDSYFVPQGISADIIATEYGYTREDADLLAVESQRRAKIAWDEGRFANSVIDVRDINGLSILDHDEYMRPQTDMQSLGSLNPAFQAMGEMMPGFDKVALMKYPHLEKINHIHHAGNSSGIVDGSAAVLIGNKEFGEKYGLKPRARIRDHVDGPCACHPENSGRQRYEHFGHRFVRSERGICRRGHVVHGQVQCRSFLGKREWWVHRNGSSFGCHRCHDHRHIAG
jgi:acetyl-CoA C-acetyltransferase